MIKMLSNYADAFLAYRVFVYVVLPALAVGIIFGLID